MTKAEAIEEWIKQVKPPVVAQASVRAKFTRMSITAEEILVDMQAKLARLSKDHVQ